MNDTPKPTPEADDEKPMGISELIARIGDDKITMQVLGSGHFHATENRRDCKIEFATAPGNGMAINHREKIGMVVWFKRSDYDAAVNASRKENQ
jgi:hypothetical protein